jgi:hypothetical protein
VGIQTNKTPLPTHNFLPAGFHKRIAKFYGDLTLVPKKELDESVSLTYRSIKSTVDSWLHFDERGYFFTFLYFIFEVPRTCYDLKILGLTKSGIYLIDPDGPGIEDAPFEVFCNMDAEGHRSIPSHRQKISI